MHTPSSFLSGFLRAAQQTELGSASPSAGGAPRRVASGTGGLGLLAGPRASAAAGRVSAPGPCRGRAALGAVPFRRPVPAAATGAALRCPPSGRGPAAQPGVGHNAQRPRLPRGLRWRRAPSASASGSAAAPPAPVWARPVLPAQPRPSPGPPALSRTAQPGSSRAARCPAQTAEAQGQQWRTGTRVPAQPLGSSSDQIQALSLPTGSASRGLCAPGAGRDPTGRPRRCWQRRGAHMCPRGGRCQVQGWGQSLPPGSDGSAGIPARGWGEGVVFSQFRANTFVSLGNLTSPWSWIHYTGLISALLQLSVVKAAARSVNSDMCTHGGARRGLPARGAPASAAFHLRGRHTGPAGRQREGAAALPPRVAGSGPKRPRSRLVLRVPRRGNPGVLTRPHRSTGPGERAGPARRRPCPNRWPPPRRDTAGAEARSAS